MKLRINIIVLFSVLMLIGVSCKKQGELVMAKSSASLQLTASASSLVLTQDMGDLQALTLSWNKADFGYASAVNYTLQVSFNDSLFKRSSSLGMGGELKSNFTTAELNTLLLGAKYPAGKASEVKLRVLAQIADSLYSYSDTVTLSITPYMAERVIGYPGLYIPGGYEGWDFAAKTIARLYSMSDDGVYEGYVYLPDAENAFKLTEGLNWDTQYGDAGTPGALSTSGTDLKVEGAGYYLLKADTKKLSWSATLNNWGIIGDAAAGWGDNDDIMFDFDPEKQVLTKTLQLKAGPMKFRANHNWDLNIGEGFQYGAGDITITEPGTYLIILDLRVPGEIEASMTLQ